MLDGSYYFECYCYFDEHTIRFVLNKNLNEDEPPELYTSFFLNEGRGFFHRLWLGIKYIFGGVSRYGNFGSWTLCEEDLGKLENMVKDYSNALEKWKLNNPQLYNKKA